jgi:hypothetical protein
MESKNTGFASPLSSIRNPKNTGTPVAATPNNKTNVGAALVATTLNFGSPVGKMGSPSGQGGGSRKQKKRRSSQRTKKSRRSKVSRR